MSFDHDHTLKDEELHFLMKDGRGSQIEEEESSDQGEPVIATFCGDLSSVSLPDILQTVTMSGMEGTLKIRAGKENTFLHLAGGKTRILPPLEAWIRRMHRHLVKCSQIDSKKVKQALFQLASEGGFLGDHLCADGTIDRDFFNSLQAALEEDFLFETFMQKQGDFAFFKDRIPSKELEERIPHAIPFDTASCLLDIARRTDEWEMIMETLGSLDEVLVPIGDAPPAEEGLHRDLYLEIDGAHGLREIAGGFLDSLFEVAKAASQLLSQGMVRKAEPSELLDLAREAAAREDYEAAFGHLDVLRRLRPLESDEELEAVATLLKEIGDPKDAARIQKTRADMQEDPEIRRSLLEDAHRSDPRNPEYVEALVRCLAPTDPKCGDLITTLADLLLQKNEARKALDLLDGLLPGREADLVLATQRARVLSSLDRKSEAVSVLEELADRYRAGKDRERLAKVLEQILKIDGSLKKPRSELRALRRGGKRIPIPVLLSAGILLLLGGVIYGSRDSASGAEAKSLLERAKAFLEEGRLDSALRIVSEAVARSEEEEFRVEARDLEKRISARIESEKHRAAEAVRDRFNEEIRRSASHLEAGDYVKGLLAFAKIEKEYSKDPSFRDQVKDSLRYRVAPLLEAWNREISEGSTIDLERILKILDPEERKRSLLRLEAIFKEREFESVGKLADLVAGDERIGKMQGLPPKFTEVLETYLKTGKRILVVRSALRKRVEEDREKERLGKPFLEAQRAEQDHDFAKAYTLYSKLVREYRGDEGLRKIFDAKRKRYGSILAEMKALERHTAEGNYLKAQARFLRLKKLHPDIPFAELVELPFRVTTNPPGAEVRVEGKILGKSPLLGRFHPKERPEIEIRLPGFKTVLPSGDLWRRGSFDLVLEMLPDWSRELEGALTNPPALDGSRVLVGDRSGKLHVLDLRSGKQLLAKDLGVLSGKIGTPALVRGLVIFAAPEGLVRALDPKTGAKAWERRLQGPLLPGVVPLEEGVLVLSREGRMVLLSPKTGDALVEKELRASFQVRPLPLPGGEGFLTLDRKGRLTLRDARGEAAWERRIPEAGWLRPRLAGSRILLSSDDGFLHALDRNDGSLLWSAEVGDALRIRPVGFGDRIFVATGRRELLRLDAKNGRLLGKRSLEALPSADLSLAEGYLLLPLRKRGVLAVSPEDLRPFCRFAEGRTTETPMVSAGDAYLLFLDAKGSLLAFPKRRLTLH